jgi:hypothetical protein
MQYYKCPKCEEEFMEKSKYNEHIKLEPCVIRMYIDKYNYDEYEKIPPFFSEHVNFKKMLVGNNHQYRPLSENSEEEHYQKEDNEQIDTEPKIETKIYQCKLCDNTFSRVDSMSRHTKKFCKVKKELEALKERNPHLIDERIENGDFDMEDFKQKIDEIMQNYFANKKTN